jgi:hypothetical protein
VAPLCLNNISGGLVQTFLASHTATHYTMTEAEKLRTLWTFHVTNHKTSLNFAFLISSINSVTVSQTKPITLHNLMKQSRTIKIIITFEQKRLA